MTDERDEEKEQRATFHTPNYLCSLTYIHFLFFAVHIGRCSILSKIFIVLLYLFRTQLPIVISLTASARVFRPRSRVVF